MNHEDLFELFALAMSERPVSKIYEVYILDPQGKPIEHTVANHHELTFLDHEEAITKAEELMDEGEEVEIIHIGPI